MYKLKISCKANIYWRSSVDYKIGSSHNHDVIPLNRSTTILEEKAPNDELPQPEQSIYPHNIIIVSGRDFNSYH